MSFRTAWDHTRGYSAAILIMAVCFVVFVAACGWFVGILAAFLPLVWVLLMAGVQWLATMLGISMLTTLYGVAVEGRDL